MHKYTVFSEIEFDNHIAKKNDAFEEKIGIFTILLFISI